MLFKELRRIKKSDGVLPIEELRRLQLPMPDDVLEQVLVDHGHNGDFQGQYGELDLHALAWRLATLPASDILAASIYPDFAGWTDMIADRTRVVATRGWGGVKLPSGASQSWQERSTWLRPPVALTGEVMRSDRTIHLVEGHTRLGALKGLVECGYLEAASLHDIWVGEPVSARPQVEGDPDRR